MCKHLKCSCCTTMNMLWGFLRLVLLEYFYDLASLIWYLIKYSLVALQRNFCFWMNWKQREIFFLHRTKAISTNRMGLIKNIMGSRPSAECHFNWWRSKVQQEQLSSTASVLFSINEHLYDIFSIFVTPINH